MPFDFIKKTMMTGIGFALKTQSEIESLTKDFVEKTKMSEDEGRKFVDEMIDKYNEAKDNMQEQIDKGVKKAMDKVDVARKSDVEDLQKIIDELRKEISELKKVK
jgi:polyhydroxyalkanoate synthesis regulator phasin